MRNNDIPKPIIKGTQPATGNSAFKLKNIEWLQQHHQEYHGQWIALHNGQLLGAHESFVELRQVLKNLGQLKSTIFINLKVNV
ncbi:MAG: hypothetical protein BWK78_07230 [Thiotrichaceae bacterium IS1]|nr:MAG: hypothetical protein BWK78_07230 [Thiotrichaceae bacterium IS1]